MHKTSSIFYEYGFLKKSRQELCGQFQLLDRLLNECYDFKFKIVRWMQWFQVLDCLLWGHSEVEWGLFAKQTLTLPWNRMLGNCSILSYVPEKSFMVKYKH